MGKLLPWNSAFILLDALLQFVDDELERGDYRGRVFRRVRRRRRSVGVTLRTTSRTQTPADRRPARSHH